MKRTHGIIVIILGALAIIFVSAYLMWFAPSDFRGEHENFVVGSGQSIASVIEELKSEGLVRSTFGTKLAFRLSGVGAIKDGSYSVSPRMDAWQVARVIGRGESSAARVTIPEGYTVEQIADRFEEQGIIVASTFKTATLSFNSDKAFLSSRPSGSLEGYLFPDTYNLARGAEASNLISLLINNFERRIAPLSEQIEAHEYSLHEIITLASLIEKEARTDKDRKLVSGVLFNRLRIGMRLDVDATVRYITNNWSKPITQADLNINSPYNTRRFAGLPPGPICNPGLAAIEAVLFPTENDYFYYLHDANGNTHFAKTLDEHNINKARYL